MQHEALQPLHQLLQPYGVSFVGQRVLLQDEPAALRLNLERRFRRSPAEAKGLLSAIETALGPDDCACILLSPSYIGNGFGPCASEQCDSLLRILLGVEQLQARIACALLEKLPECTGGDVSMARLLLSPLRWLDVVYQPKEIWATASDVIKACQPSVQRELLAALPEFLDESVHASIVECVEELMRASADMISPALDALSNLGLKHALAVRSQTLEALESIPLEQLPVVVRFLCQTASKDSAAQTAAMLREKLTFAKVAVALEGKRAKGAFGKGAAQQGTPALVVESIRNGLRFQSVLAVELLKQLGEPGKLRALDVWLLALLHEIPSHCKQVDRLLVRKLLR